MSNPLKSKLILIIVSVLILILIPLFKSNFNAPVSYYKWKQVTWDDFQGFVKPFTGWGAGISSNVYIEYDSTTETYAAYAMMNNQLSWKKESSVESAYLLNHEQYHFNITEYLSRKLNYIIRSQELKSESQILVHLAKIRSELTEMQDAYDTESDHSSNRDKQKNWEYRIDSLLIGFSVDSGWVTDFYSGGRIFMPSSAYFRTGINKNQSVFRLFQLDKYDMNLAMASFQYVSFSKETLTEDLKLYYETDSVEIKVFQIDSVNYDYKAYVAAEDSIKQKSIRHLWVYQNDYLFKLTAAFSNDAEEVDGYEKIAHSFINSFQIVKTEKYWLDKLSSSDSKYVTSSATPYTKTNNEKKDKSDKCATYGEYVQYGFYAKPIFREDGALLLPYTIISHADSLINEVMAIYESEWFSYEMDSADQILYIPSRKLKGDTISLVFGHLLKEDTSKECFMLYNQYLEIPRRLPN